MRGGERARDGVCHATRFALVCIVNRPDNERGLSGARLLHGVVGRRHGIGQRSRRSVGRFQAGR